VPTPQPGLLRDHGFRNLFAAVTIAAFGQRITAVAIPFVAVVSLHATEFEVGLLNALATGAIVVLGLPAGAWVDRMRRRHVLVFNDLARSAVLVSIPVAWWLGGLSMWQLYVISIVVGICTIFFDIASQSFLPDLVGRANIVEANSKQEGVRQTAALGGPALAGQVVAWLSAPVSVLITSVALAVSALFTMRIRHRETKVPRRPDASLRREIGEGLRFVVGNRLLRSMAASTAWSNLCSGGYFALNLVFMVRVLDLSPELVGLLLSAGGVGGLIGALTARRVAAWVGQGPAMWLAFLLSAPFSLVLPLSGADWRLWLVALSSLIAAGLISVFNITLISARQQMAPDALQGRVNATMRFLNWFTLPFGSLLGGALGGWLGSRQALVVLAVAGCLAFLPIFLSPLRTMRELPVIPQTEPAAALVVG
jgi:MFS family permease